MLKRYCLIIVCAVVCIAAHAGTARMDVLARIRSMAHSQDFANPTLSTRSDSLNKIQPSVLKSTDVMQFEYDVINHLLAQRKQSEVIKLCMYTLPLLSDEIGNDKNEIRLFILLLNQFGITGPGFASYSTIFNFYLKGYDLAKKSNMKEEMAILQNNVSSMYIKLKNYDKAIAALKEAIAINENLKSKERLFINYNNLSAAYTYKNNYDKALEYAFLAMHQLESRNDKDKIMLMQRNICTIYRKKGLTSFALENLQDVMRYQENNRQYIYLSDTYRMMGSLYGAMGKFGEAKSYFDKAVAFSEKYSTLSQKADLFKSYSDMYASSGDFGNAYTTLQRHFDLKDSITRNESNNQITLLMDLYTIEQKQYAASKKEQAATLEIVAEWKYAAIAILLVAALIIYLMKKHHRAIKRLNYQRSLCQIMEMQEEMNASETIVDKLKAQIDQKDGELKQAEAKMMSIALQQQYDSDFRTQLSEDLKQLLLKINPKSTQTKSDIKDIILRLNQYGNNNEMNIFNETFEKIHPSFYANLSASCENITTKEMQLCAMIRLGFSTKSIADLTFREIRSVESARNRLRKKLGLQQQEDLSAHLLKF